MGELVAFFWGGGNYGVGCLGGMKPVGFSNFFFFFGARGRGSCDVSVWADGEFFLEILPKHGVFVAVVKTEKKGGGKEF